LNGIDRTNKNKNDLTHYSKSSGDENTCKKWMMVNASTYGVGELLFIPIFRSHGASWKARAQHVIWLLQAASPTVKSNGFQRGIKIGPN